MLDGARRALGPGHQAGKGAIIGGGRAEAIEGRGAAQARAEPRPSGQDQHAERDGRDTQRQHRREAVPELQRDLGRPPQHRRDRAVHQPDAEDRGRGAGQQAEKGEKHRAGEHGFRRVVRSCRGRA